MGPITKIVTNSQQGLLTLLNPKETKEVAEAILNLKQAVDSAEHAVAGCDHLLNLYIARYGEDILIEEGFDMEYGGEDGDENSEETGLTGEVVWIYPPFEGEEE